MLVREAVVQVVVQHRVQRRRRAARATESQRCQRGEAWDEGCYLVPSVTTCFQSIQGQWRRTKMRMSDAAPLVGAAATWLGQKRAQRPPPNSPGRTAVDESGEHMIKTVQSQVDGEQEADQHLCRVQASRQ